MHRLGCSVLLVLCATAALAIRREPVASVTSYPRGVVSHSDGQLDNPTGRLLFYMTPMDEVAHNVLADPRCSYTIAEEQLHPDGCDGTDPEDPTCAKISVLGKMLPVPEGKQEEARQLLFSRHPDMASWPDDHNFQLFEIAIDEVHLLDWYGGMHIITAADYFAAHLGTAAVL